MNYFIIEIKQTQDANRLSTKQEYEIVGETSEYLHAASEIDERVIKGTINQFVIAKDKR